MYSLVETSPGAHHSVLVNRVAHGALSAASTRPLELDVEVVSLARPGSFAVLCVEVVDIVLSQGCLPLPLETEQGMLKNLVCAPFA